MGYMEINLKHHHHHNKTSGGGGGVVSVEPQQEYMTKLWKLEQRSLFSMLAYIQLF